MATTDDGAEFAKRYQRRIRTDRFKELVEAERERDRLLALVAAHRAELEHTKIERDSAKAEVESLKHERDIYRSLVEDRISQRPQHQPPTSPSGPNPWHGFGQRSIFDH